MFDLLLNLIQELIFYSGYVANGNAFPKQHSKKDEEKYLNLYKEGDQSAKNILIEHNLSLVAHIA